MDTFFLSNHINIKELITRLDQIRSQPSLISWGQYNQDMAACAAAVRKSSTNEIIAALSVSCPIGTYDEDTFKTKIAKQIVYSAKKISKLIY